MILTDQKILEAIEAKQIVITPFRRECLGSNSYDVHLGNKLGIYVFDILDSRIENQVRFIDIPKEGFLMQPGQLYLGVTEEYTETLAHVPFLEGKSSIGRLGIGIHCTAGKGDVGFKNHWTMEISCIKPIWIYPGMKVGQLIYFEVSGEVGTPYDKKATAKYTLKEDLPQASRNFENFK